ncbi:hypothetical protein RclHR1_10260003 [Rhizophagus clarus]|nr:hypothetical protein RclHR1_10260003 [Rhizophagus clarus]
MIKTDTIITDTNQMMITDATITDDKSVDEITAAMTDVTIVDSKIPETEDRKKIIKKNHDDNAVLIHEYIYDDDDVMLKCRLCEDVFISNKEFNKHAKSEHDVKCLCFSCSEVFHDKKLCGRHINKCHTIYYCIYCVKRFSVEESLEKHILEFHSNSHNIVNKDLEVINENSNVSLKNDELREVKFDENINTITNNKEAAIFLHEILQDDNSGTIIKCKKCGKTFKFLSIFKSHVSSVHNFKWLCFVCCQVFPSGSTREKHMREFHTRDFSCTLCIRRFYNEDALMEHFHTKHRESIPHIPTTSSVPLPTSSSELQEVSFIHDIIPYDHPTDEKHPYQLKCKICDYIFNSHSQFNKHAKASHNVGFMCSLCSQIFPQKSLKKEHSRCNHFFTCQICGKVLRSEDGLKYHETIHNQMNINSQHEETSYEPIAARLRSRKMKNDSSKDDDDVMDESQTSSESSESQTTVFFIHEIVPTEFSSNKSNSYQLKCNICEKLFDNHSKFNKHARKLHNYKFICSICSQIFSQKSLEKEHIRQVHSVECRDCGRKFGDKSSLMSHCKAKNHQQDVYNFPQREKTSYEPIVTRLRSRRMKIKIKIKDDDNEMNKMDEDKDSFFDDYNTEERSKSLEKEHTRQAHVECRDCGRKFSNEKDLMNHRVAAQMKKMKNHLPKDEDDDMNKMSVDKDGNHDNEERSNHDDKISREHNHTTLPQISIPSQTSTSQTTTVKKKCFIHKIIPCEHQSSSHLLKCQICESTFQSHQEFNEHARKKHNYKYLCSFCSQIFTQERQKKGHQKLVHGVKCPFCEKKFTNENSLKDHCISKNHYPDNDFYIKFDDHKRAMIHFPAKNLDINTVNSNQDNSPIVAHSRSEDLEMNSVSNDEKGKCRKYDSIKEDEPEGEPEVSFKKFRKGDDGDSFF